MAKSTKTTAKQQPRNDAPATTTEDVSQATVIEPVQELLGVRILGHHEYYIVGQLAQQWPGLNKFDGSVVTEIIPTATGAIVRFANKHEEQIIGAVGLMYREKEMCVSERDRCPDAL